MLTTLAIFVFAIIFAVLLLQLFAQNRAKQMRGQQVSEEILKSLKLPRHHPALLYFTSPGCSMCRIREQEMGKWQPAGVRFVKVNIANKLNDFS